MRQSARIARYLTLPLGLSLALACGAATEEDASGNPSPKQLCQACANNAASLSLLLLGSLCGYREPDIAELSQCRSEYGQAINCHLQHPPECSMSTASLDERCAALEADYQRCVESDPIARCLEFDTVPTDLFECERCACQACACEGACSREYERWRSCLKTCRDRGDQERAACEGECDGAVESVLADSLGCFSENGVQACLSLCQP